MVSKKVIGVVDTMFARGDMGGLAEKTLFSYSKQLGVSKQLEIARVTVPGFKDLAAACVKLFREKNASICVALGMAGGETIDETCAMVSDMGLQYAQVQEGRHIIGVMVYSNEARVNGKIDDAKLASIMRHRVTEHSKNALEMAFFPDKLRKRAGTGQRQGGKNASFFEL